MHRKTAIEHGKEYGTAWHQHVLVRSDNITIQSDGKLNVTCQFMIQHKSAYDTASLINAKLCLQLHYNYDIQYTHIKWCNFLLLLVFL